MSTATATLPFAPITDASSLAAALLRAQTLALEKLTALLRSSKLEREIRLAALAILRFKPFALGYPHAPGGAVAPPFQALRQPSASKETVTTSPVSPHATTSGRSPVPHSPLTAAELVTLHQLLPHVDPTRFTKKHTPAHWREVIARHQRNVPSPSPAPNHTASPHRRGAGDAPRAQAA